MLQLDVLPNVAQLRGDNQVIQRLRGVLCYADPTAPTGYTSVVDRLGRFSPGLVARVCWLLQQWGVPYEVRSGVPNHARPIVVEDLPIWEFLFQHQRDGLRAMLEHNRGIYMAPARSGKTYSQAALLQALPDLRPALVVVDNAQELLTQTHAKLEELLGEKVGRLGGGRKDVDCPITVATVQSLARRVKSRLVQDCRLYIRDECVPGGTMVGDKAIRDIVVGDTVPSYDEATKQVVLKRVTRVMKRRYDGEFVELRWGPTKPDSGVVWTTPQHPAYLDRVGWVAAEDIVERYHATTGGYFKEFFDSLLVLTSSSTVMPRRVQGSKCYGPPDFDGYVYNIEVEDTHCYFANGILVHNCHHAAASSDEKVLWAAENLERCYGFSATPWRHDEKNLVLEANIGPLVYRITWSRLIRDINPLTGRPFLVSPIVVFQRMPSKTFRQDAYWEDVYRSAVLENGLRNQAAVDFMYWMESLGRTSVATVSRIDHGETLSELSGAPFTQGSDSPRRRGEVLERLRTREIPAAISTLYREAVDIPSLDGMCNAMAGKSSIDFYQRMRNMTTFEGKFIAPIFDFYDRSGVTSNWSRLRYRASCEEPAFKVVIRSDYEDGKCPDPQKVWGWLEPYVAGELPLSALS